MIVIYIVTLILRNTSCLTELSSILFSEHLYQILLVSVEPTERVQCHHQIDLSSEKKQGDISVQHYRYVSSESYHAVYRDH